MKSLDSTVKIQSRHNKITRWSYCDDPEIEYCSMPLLFRPCLKNLDLCWDLLASATRWDSGPGIEFNNAGATGCQCMNGCWTSVQLCSFLRELNFENQIWEVLYCTLGYSSTVLQKWHPDRTIRDSVSGDVVLVRLAACQYGEMAARQWR